MLGATILGLMLQVQPSAPPPTPTRAAVDLDREMVVYRELTRSRVRCESDTDEIVVCARREADIYRVPFLLPATGERDNVGAFDARAMLLRQPNPCETKIGNTPYGCGMFGVGVTAGGGRLRMTERPLAP